MKFRSSPACLINIAIQTLMKACFLYFLVFTQDIIAFQVVIIISVSPLSPNQASKCCRTCANASTTMPDFHLPDDPVVQNATLVAWDFSTRSASQIFIVFQSILQITPCYLRQTQQKTCFSQQHPKQSEQPAITVAINLLRIFCLDLGATNATCPKALESTTRPTIIFLKTTS